MAKCITLKQPWAELVVIGAKRFETRSWKTAYRGELYIHSSSHLDFWDLEMCQQDERFRSAIKSPHLLQVGKIIGKVRIIDCMPVDELAPFLHEQGHRNELAFGDYRQGRWGWELGEPVKFTNPVKCLGALSIWDFDDSVYNFLTN